MNGVITTKHLILNAATIIAAFGLSVYIKAVMSVVKRENKTFLEVVW